MKRSENRILTTHVGSLPRPQDLVVLFRDKLDGKQIDQPAFRSRLQNAVADVVTKQTELGIDIITDGEYGKPSWSGYVVARLAGYELDSTGTPSQRRSRDREDFPGFYAEYDEMYSFSNNETWGRVAASGRPAVCTGPISYSNRSEIDRDIANLKDAMQDSSAVEGYLPAVSPTMRPGAEPLLRER